MRICFIGALGLFLNPLEVSVGIPTLTLLKGRKEVSIGISTMKLLELGKADLLLTPFVVVI